jgi:hypothetical protein
MLARGILMNASHNVCWAHDATDMARMRQAWDGALGVVAQEIAGGALIEHLKAPIIEPIFKVR